VSDEATKTRSEPIRHVALWKLEVVSGPSRGFARELAAGKFRIGSSQSNDLAIEDLAVSRQHLEITVTELGIHVRDLGSKNGTFYRGSRIEAADLPIAGGILTLGETEIAIFPADAPSDLAPSPRERLCRLVGKSERMRLLFARIERIAASNATVLIHGETGTGKELVAEALHELSARRAHPIEVVDCGAIPRELIESELFGHTKGSFTGAVADRQGAFERADGGTLLLDEIGELEIALQPKLLRVLETGQVRPVGAERTITVDVRVIAASHRELPAEVREGRFREDLFYRLAVIHLDVPPLRERLEDVPLLVESFLGELGAPPLSASALRILERYEWPGNVRQLRNVLDRAVALSGGGPIAITEADLDLPSAYTSPAQLLALPYKEAKEEVVARFTRDYLEALLARNQGNVSAASREAKVDRNWIVALARRYGVRVRD
jgi:two-component system, NtrC family, response regulator